METIINDKTYILAPNIESGCVECAFQGKADECIKAGTACLTTIVPMVWKLKTEENV